MDNGGREWNRMEWNGTKEFSNEEINNVKDAEQLFTFGVIFFVCVADHTILK